MWFFITYYYFFLIFQYIDNDLQPFSQQQFWNLNKFKIKIIKLMKFFLNFVILFCTKYRNKSVFILNCWWIRLFNSAKWIFNYRCAITQARIVKHIFYIFAQKKNIIIYIIIIFGLILKILFIIKHYIINI